MEQKQEFFFSFTLEEANVVAAGLGKLPYENVAGLIEKMNYQFNEQVKNLPQQEEVGDNNQEAEVETGVEGGVELQE